MDQPRGMQERVSLAPRTSMGVGGKARWLLELEDGDDLHRATAFASSRGIPLLVLGGGSNLICSDAGFDGLVVQMLNKGLKSQRAESGVRLRIEAGEKMDDVCAYAAKRNWSGIECLSGIPGTAGAGPIQNIGAYGQELSECLRWVEVFDPASGALIRMDAQECELGYRDSWFKRHPGDRIPVLFCLQLGIDRGGAVKYRDVARAVEALGLTDPSPGDVRGIVLAIRKRKSMVLDRRDAESRGCGSFFTNPVVSAQQAADLGARFGAEMPCYPLPNGDAKLAAAWLIERAGFEKGTRFGRVGLSHKHALALVNRGGASAAEVVDAARRIRDCVLSKFGVRLVPEPVLVGFGTDFAF